MTAEVQPPASADEHVQTEGESSSSQGGNHGFEVFEFGANGRPAVDHKEEVAVAVVNLAVGSPLPIGLDRVDALRAEVQLAGVHDRGDLSDRAAHHIRFGPGSDPGHVGEVSEGGEGSAAEVDHIDLSLARGLGEGEGRDGGAQQGALSRTRASDHRHVSSGASKADLKCLAALFERKVNHAERDGELASRPPAGGEQSASRLDHQVGGKQIKGGRDLERGQPDLVGCWATPGHGFHGEVEGGALIALVRRNRGGCRGLGGGRCLDLVDRERGEGDRLVHGTGPFGRPALRRRAGHVGRSELDHRGGVGLEVTDTWDTGQRVGVGDAKHGPRFGGREGAKPDPVGQVRFQTAQAALLQSLRGKQQVHLERAAEAADGHEQFGELGLSREKFGELVTHDQQRWKGCEVIAATLARLLVLAHVGEVACRSKQLLAAGHLALECILHAVNERELLTKVGDDRRDVRHAGHSGEGSSTLEVHQHEVQVFRGVSHRERENERPQHLRLSRTGGPNDESVRAHSLLSRFLNVEVHERASIGLADWDAELVSQRPWPPGLGYIKIAHIADAEQIHELGGGGASRSVIVLAAVAGEPGEAAGCCLGSGDGKLIGLPDPRFVADAQEL